MFGLVTSFGADGWGTVEADGGGSYPFHSTAIVDGSRHIDVGARVRFERAPGRQGRWEASAVEHC